MELLRVRHLQEPRLPCCALSWSGAESASRFPQFIGLLSAPATRDRRCLRMFKMTSTSRNQTPVDFEFRVPALEVTQGSGRVLYAFAIDGKAVHSFATISRIRRGEGQALSGYQRPEIL